MLNALIMAEGTKELMPTSSNYGNLEIYDMKRPFAAYYNTDPHHRLYFHIANTSERVYFGFRHIVQSGINNSTTKFRIKDPSGTIVYAYTNIPTSSGTGYIGSYSAAVAGPKINGSPSNGYSPFSFTPSITGDFYMEFNTDTSQDTYHIDYFDLTVINSNNEHINGRLWSYAWDLSTRSFDNGFNASMYIYADDGFVSKANFNGIQAYGFVIACNSTGPGDLPGGNNDNRKSLAGNSTRPQYKIFLNDPDINSYPSGSLPQIVQNLNVIGTPTYGQPVLFTVNVSQAGIVQIVLDINGIYGYQANSSDVILVEPVHAGLDTIIWDGKDGFGNYVIGNTNVLVLSSFASGTTHLPLYDPETHPNGYIVERIRPATGRCDLFWDDSNFSGGTVNIDGSILTGHSWAYFFGDVRTMNTWWNGYQLDILNNFEFIVHIPLPISLLDFTAIADKDKVLLNWATASELNNDFFTVEKSSDAIDFEPITTIIGAGNSNTIIEYQYKDMTPYTGVSYYRIKQTDYDGKFSYSEIRAVKFLLPLSGFSVYPNPVKSGEILQIIPDNNWDVSYTISVYALNGQKVAEFNTDGAFSFLINASLNKGVYFLVISSWEESIINKIVIQ